MSTDRLAAPDLLGQTAAPQSGDLGDAEHLCLASHSGGISDADALRPLGLIQHRHGRIAKALAWLDRALAPDDAVPLSDRADMLKALGRSEEALAAYRRASEIRPDYVEALNGRLPRQSRPKDGSDVVARVASELRRLTDSHRAPLTPVRNPL